MTQRKAIHAYVTDESKAGWEGFAEEQGCSVTSLVETEGVRLLALLDSGGELTVQEQGWVAQSRRIDAERRRREQQG